MHLGHEFEDINYKIFGFYSELNEKPLKVFELEREKGDQSGNSRTIFQVRCDGALGPVENILRK